MQSNFKFKSEEFKFNIAETSKPIVLLLLLLVVVVVVVAVVVVVVVVVMKCQ